MDGKRSGRSAVMSPVIGWQSAYRFHFRPCGGLLTEVCGLVLGWLGCGVGIMGGCIEFRLMWIWYRWPRTMAMDWGGYLQTREEDSLSQVVN